MNHSDQTLTNPVLLCDVAKQSLDVNKRRNEQKLTSKHKKKAERLQELHELEQELSSIQCDHTKIVDQLSSQLKTAIQTLERERSDGLRTRELERQDFRQQIDNLEIIQVSLKDTVQASHATVIKLQDPRLWGITLVLWWRVQTQRARLRLKWR